MSAKALVSLGMFLGTTVGGYAPVLFGADIFSYWSLLGTLLGGILGIIIGWKLSNL